MSGYKLVGGFAVFILSSCIVVLYAYPAMIAIACPSCMGFEEIGDNIYVDQAMPSAQRNEVAVHIRESAEAVESFFGGLTVRPMIFACSSEQCYQSLGGKTARAAAFGATAIRLSPRGLNDAIAKHELTHIEFHARLGMWTTMRRLPVWFDEGLAVLVSQDPRYIGPQSATSTSGSEVREITSLRQWNMVARDDGQRTYSAAYQEVKTWYDKEGHAGLLMLIERLKQGASFAEASAS